MKKTKHVLEAFDLISKWDEEKGESWSNDSTQIAEIMVEFLNTHNEVILDLFYRKTKNRRYIKQWESDMLNLLEDGEPE